MIEYRALAARARTEELHDRLDELKVLLNHFPEGPRTEVLKAGIKIIEEELEERNG